MQLSVVVPVLNEVDNVESLVREIGEALDGNVDYEIVYVDDGSTDGTVERLTEVQERLPASRLRVLRFHRNFGQSAALRVGIESARAPWIVTLDGDGQNDPADIPKLLALRDAPDAPDDLQLVSSLRLKRRDNWLRRVSSKLANGIRQRLLCDGTPDSATGFKLFRRDAFLALPYFDHMHRFIPALIQRSGGKMLTVEVNHRPRRHGISKYGVHNRLWTGILDLLGVWWLQRRFVAPTFEELTPECDAEDS